MDAHSLFASATINVGIAFFILSIFSIFKKHSSNSLIYYARRLSHKNTQIPFPPSFTLSSLLPSFSWILPLFRVTEDQILENTGLDALVVVRLFKFGVRFFLVCSVLGVVLLVPVNYSSELNPLRSKRSLSMDAFTISNVGVGSNRLWVHYTCLFLISFYGLYLLHKIAIVIATEKMDEYNGGDYDTRYNLENGTILLLWYPKQMCSSEVFYPAHEASTLSMSENLILMYVAMGFPKDVVRKVIQENGENGTYHILETILTYTAGHSARSSDGPRSPVGHFEEGSSSASSSAIPSDSLLSRLVGMGFPIEIVRRVIKENGQSNEGLIVEALLTHSALNDSSPECRNDCDDFPDLDNFLNNEEDIEHQFNKDRKLLDLTDMGFPFDEAYSAIDASGPNSSIQELMDFIYAAQTSKSVDAPMQERDQPIAKEINASYHDGQAPEIIKERYDKDGLQRWKRKCETWQRQAKVSRDKKVARRFEGDVTVHIPKHMIGFGVPNNPVPNFHRDIPEAAIGPPFFYYENVAWTPKGVWDTISRFLFEIQPEFVNSLNFCSAARKRGYIHNLPVHNRFLIHPIPPLTIQEALPLTKKWWPSWDNRTQLNCLNTCVASAKLTERLRICLENCDGNPSMEAKKYILYNCKKWNLVWTGKNKLAPLEPDEMELILGYPKDHTRGGVSRADRSKSLGNSFQDLHLTSVFTVSRYTSPFQYVKEQEGARLNFTV